MSILCRQHNYLIIKQKKDLKSTEKVDNLSTKNLTTY